ncbi:NAD(P)-binding protein [Lojkania enalia]|uniref:NAD(P)-binding protein n=1 Tax=Lojkania enalia TaxID=147567 RepID=A0A9P4K5C7_9PLEO|nr:NAD(P)-binding protein [Didymosphaeria enalia]
MTGQTIYFVTGANRGLGRALVEHYLALPNSFVAAGVRDPEHSTAKSLFDFPKGENSTLVTVKVEATSDTDAKEAVTTLQKEHSIDHLDVVISSAGICRLSRLDEVDIADLLDHVNVNAVGVVRLFQATKDLLQKTKNPKFVVMGSNAGSVAHMQWFPFPQGAYAGSKAMTNSIMRKIAMENPWLTSVTLHPGWVQTDMGNDGARAVGMEKAAVTIEDSIKGVTEIIEKANPQTIFGKFLDYAGAELEW